MPTASSCSTQRPHRRAGHARRADRAQRRVRAAASHPVRDRRGRAPDGARRPRDGRPLRDRAHRGVARLGRPGDPHPDRGRGLHRARPRVVVYAAPGARILDEAPRFGVPAVALPIGAQAAARRARAARARSAREPVDVVNTHSSTDTWLAALACRWLRDARPRRARCSCARATCRCPCRTTARRAGSTAARPRASSPPARRCARSWSATTASIRARIDSVPDRHRPARFMPRDKATARARARPAARALPLVGIVATLRSWKGHRYLLDALPRIAPRRRAARRSSATGRSARRSKRRPTRSASRARVMFAGQQDDVAPWLAALDVFALPSYANEGVPQALLQAMFAGVPCVTTDAGAIPEIARDGETALVVAREDARRARRGARRAARRSPRWRGARRQRARAFVAAALRPCDDARPDGSRVPPRARRERPADMTRRPHRVAHACAEPLRRPRERRGARARAAPTAAHAAGVDPRRILVAHHLLLGDTLMLTPLLAKLRERHPGADIAMTVPRAVAPLYAGRPYGVRALAWDPREPRAAPVRRSAVRPRVRARRQPLRVARRGDARALDRRVRAATGRRRKNWPVDALVPLSAHARRRGAT